MRFLHQWNSTFRQQRPAIKGINCLRSSDCLGYEGDGHPTFKRESLYWVYKPYCRVDDHPLIIWKQGEFRPQTAAPLETKLIFEGPIFHCHDGGRKRILFHCRNYSAFTGIRGIPINPQQIDHYNEMGCTPEI